MTARPPAPRTAGSCGSIPIPATAKSQSDPLGRSAVTAASTRSAPSNAVTLSPASSSTPCSRWIAANAAPTCIAENALERQRRPAKIAVTRTPSCVQRSGDLAADEAHPDHDRVPACAASRLIASHSATVRSWWIPCELGAGNVEPAVAPTGRDQQLLVGELLAGIERDRVCAGVDRDDAGFAERRSTSCS